MTVTVYTQPECIQCTMTFRALDKANIGYSVVDVSCDDEAREYVKALGYLSTPVVVAGETHWSGFRRERIQQLADQDLVSA